MPTCPIHLPSRECRRAKWARVRTLLVLVLLFGAASTVRAATVTALWNANPEPEVTGYRLSYGAQSGVYSNFVNVGKVTSTPVTLTGGRRYYFAVQALTASAISPFSSEVFFDVPADPVNVIPTFTTQPMNRAIASRQTASFTVAATGTPMPTYRWQVSMTGGASWTNLTNSGSYSGTTTSTLTVTNPASLNMALYRCIATNVAGSATSGAVWLKVSNAAVWSDFDGDQKADLTVYRSSTGMWLVEQTKANYTTYVTRQWGLATDEIVPGDYDGDGLSDPAVFRASTGTWYILQSSSNYTMFRAIQWGLATDILVQGDYDGDGMVDPAVYRPSTGTWLILRSVGNYTTFLSYQWGVATDVVTPGDYDGDGKTDVAVFRPSTGFWYILQSSTSNLVSSQWGVATDIPVAADYDGDGRTDIAVFRPSTSTWNIIQSGNGALISQMWGTVGDVVVPSDYDGDGKTDLATFRPSNGTWNIRSSATGATIVSPWGLGSDMPVNKRP